MFVREIHWTEESEEHIARHNVHPTEVEQIVNSRPRVEQPSREETTKVFGLTDDGRPLAMTATERRAFRRKTGS